MGDERAPRGIVLEAAGGDVVAEPLLVHPGSVPPELMELTVEHYREAASRA